MTFRGDVYEVRCGAASFWGGGALALQNGVGGILLSGPWCQVGMDNSCCCAKHDSTVSGDRFEPILIMYEAVPSHGGM